MINVIIFIIIHWFVSLFFQTFFLHRYASHKMFTMSPFTEKVFMVLTFLAQGPSYLSAYAYGAMHRMHHAYADTEKDPHSPKYDKNVWEMMKKTATIYAGILRGKIPVDPQFSPGLPRWDRFEIPFSSWIARVITGAMYVVIYIWVLQAPWYALFLVPLHWIMGPVHGAIINWGAHKYGYRNYSLENTSKNMFPIEIVMLGEGLHNNHHAKSKDPNFAKKWFEFDPVYPIIVVLDALKIIQLTVKSSR